MLNDLSVYWVCDVCETDGVVLCCPPYGGYGV